MKSSHKLSFASLAALGLPIAGIGVAAAQELRSPAPIEAVVAEEQLNIGSKAAQVLAAGQRSSSPSNRTASDEAAAEVDAIATEIAQLVSAQTITTEVTTEADVEAVTVDVTVQEAPATDDAAAVKPAAEEAPAVEVTNEPIDPMRGWSEDDFGAYRAYWEAGYNYQQLLVLADEWNLSEFEAKARAGAAILAGDTSSFDSIVAGIEPGPAESTDTEVNAPSPADAFWDAGYTYDDALVLAEAWNIDTWEAKVLAAEIIENGFEDDVQSILNAG